MTWVPSTPVPRTSGVVVETSESGLLADTCRLLPKHGWSWRQITRCDSREERRKTGSVGKWPLFPDSCSIRLLTGPVCALGRIRRRRARVPQTVAGEFVDTLRGSFSDCGGDPRCDLILLYARFFQTSLSAGRKNSPRAGPFHVSPIDTRALRCEHARFTHQQGNPHAEAQTRAHLDRPSPYAGRYQPRPSPGLSAAGARQATPPWGKGTKRPAGAPAAGRSAAHAQISGKRPPLP